MRTIFLSIFFLGIGLMAHAAGQSTKKGKLFIIGGGKRPNELMINMTDAANLGKSDYVVILPMSSSQPDTSYYYIKKQFQEIGFDKVVNFNFQATDKISQSRIDSLTSAKLIYITGGSQNRFMEAVTSNGVDKAIRTAYYNGSLIAGTSAGAAVMSEMMITGNQLKYPDYESTFNNIEPDNIELTQGLGFVASAIIDQHFIKRSRYNRLLTSIIEHQDIVGIGIDESTAILVSNEQAEVFGQSQVITFKNNNKSKLEKDGKLGAKKVELNIYLPGEKFKIN